MSEVGSSYTKTFRDALDERGINHYDTDGGNDTFNHIHVTTFVIDDVAYSYSETYNDGDADTYPMLRITHHMNATEAIALVDGIMQ